MAEEKKLKEDKIMDWCGECHQEPTQECVEEHNNKIYDLTLAHILTNKECEEYDNNKMKKDYYSDGVSLIRRFNDITIVDDMLECLSDMGYLNEEGQEFKKDFWGEWIEDKDTKERFIISEDTIEDTQSGLVWERDMSKRGQMNWNDAMKINDNGFTLPSRREFKTLSNSKEYPTVKELEEIGFSNVNYWYWTNDVHNRCFAYFVRFSDGYSDMNDVTSSHYVLCVRKK